MDNAVWVPAFAGTTMEFFERHLRKPIRRAGLNLHPPYGGSRRGLLMTRPSDERHARSPSLGGQGLGGQGLGGTAQSR
jgi:hypothetical protein